jgi:hypothetical protein
MLKAGTGLRKIREGGRAKWEVAKSGRYTLTRSQNRIVAWLEQTVVLPSSHT